MGKYVIFVLCAILSCAMAPPPGTTKHYRTDYVYNRKTDAFYKLHIETVQSWHINELCEMEGAEPMIPDSDQDIMQMHAMFKNFPDLGEFIWVGDDQQKHDSAEENPIIDLTPRSSGEEEVRWLGRRCIVGTRKGDIETMSCYESLPFICKVAAKVAPYDQHCGVYSKDYKYYSSVGSCYKVSRIGVFWNQAYTECQAEGAHLMIINSEAEHQVVMNLTAGARVTNAHNPSYFHIGFRTDPRPAGDSNPRVFKTIFNQTLEEAGYTEWSATEPNNVMGRENCGSIFNYDGKLNDIDCSVYTYPFICEKEMPSNTSN